MKNLIFKLLGLVCFLFLTAVNSETLVVKPINTQPLPGSVALTFDDGPSFQYTPAILDILKKNHIHATFYIVGSEAKKFPNIIKKIIQDGNMVADHSYNHINLSKVSDEKLNFEIVGTQKLIYEMTGKTMVCFRPPYSVKSDKIESMALKNNMAIVYPGINSYDYKNLGVKQLVRRIVALSHSGSIFTFHDGALSGEDRTQTLAALPEIIQGIKNKGLNFSTICDLK